MTISDNDRRAAERKIVAETYIEMERNPFRGPYISEEERLLLENNTPQSYRHWLKGIGTTVGVFAVLRIGPIWATPYMSRLLARFSSSSRRRRQASFSSSYFFSSSTTTTTPPQSRMSSPLSSSSSSTKNDRYWDTYRIWLIIDCTLSMFAGAVITEREYCKDFLANQMQARLPPTMPLLPTTTSGQQQQQQRLHYYYYTDHYCQIVCDCIGQRRDLPATNSLTRRELGYSNNQLLNDPQTTELRTLVDFYQNCRRRFKAANYRE